MNITVYLSPTISVTSAIVNGVSEIVAGLGTTGQPLASGAVNGIVSGSTVSFANVPTASGTFTLTITNIRVNATQISSSGAPTPISETLFLSGAAVTPVILPVVNVGFATAGSSVCAKLRAGRRIASCL